MNRRNFFKKAVASAAGLSLLPKVVSVPTPKKDEPVRTATETARVAGAVDQGLRTYTHWWLNIESMVDRDCKALVFSNNATLGRYTYLISGRDELEFLSGKKGMDNAYFLMRFLADHASALDMVKSYQKGWISSYQVELIPPPYILRSVTRASKRSGMPFYISLKPWIGYDKLNAHAVAEKSLRDWLDQKCQDYLGN